MTAVILAAGEGKRMGGGRAKVLHELAGRPLIAYPITAAAAAGAARLCVVTGFAEDAVRPIVERLAQELCPRTELQFAHQPQQWGTGHAVECALPVLPRSGPVWILSGDVPMLQAATLVALAQACRRSTSGLALASFRPARPFGYGRVVRDERGAVVAIREERDANERERALTECNAGTYCVEASRLHAGIPLLGRQNAQGEKYLTDLVAWAAGFGTVIAHEIAAIEAEGVNTPQQLAELELLVRRR